MDLDQGQLKERAGFLVNVSRSLTLSSAHVHTEGGSRHLMIFLAAPKKAYYILARDYTRGDALGVRAITRHRRRGLAEGKQWVALRPIRAEPELMARCVPLALQRTVSTIEEA